MSPVLPCSAGAVSLQESRLSDPAISCFSLAGIPGSGCAPCAAFAAPLRARLASGQQLPCRGKLSFLQQQNQACLDRFHWRVGNGKTVLNICGCGPGVWLWQLGLVELLAGLLELHQCSLGAGKVTLTGFGDLALELCVAAV